MQATDVDVFLRHSFGHRRRHEKPRQQLDRNPVRDASAAHGMAGEHRLDLTDEFG
jgi:hypothetical protein